MAQLLAVAGSSYRHIRLRMTLLGLTLLRFRPPLLLLYRP
jgi:hypothetical protein